MPSFATIRHDPITSHWWVDAFGTVSFVAKNYNLKLNSPGLYELSKVCTIPCMVGYNFLVLDERRLFGGPFSLVCLSIGLFSFIADDVSFSFGGAIIALVDVIARTVYQSQTIVLRLQNVTGIQVNHTVWAVRFAIAFIARSGPGLVRRREIAHENVDCGDGSACPSHRM
jgi:solute carrier family 35 protein E3